MATTNSRCGHPELWPQILDRLARERPEAAYGLWPVASDSYDDGFSTVTYGQLATIVNNLAWWIVKELGPGSAQEGDILTYVGLNDVRLTAMILASVKAGYTLFLTSPRNSPAAQRSVFETLKCRTLVTTDPKLPPVLPILAVVKPRCLTVPGIDELLSAQSSPPFPYDKSFDAGHWDPLVIWHTSGSTGMPKPLAFTQEGAARHHACASQDVPDDATSVERLMAGKRVMVTVPPFHGAGILQYMLWAIPAGCIPIAPAAVGIVTAHGLVEALTHTPAEIAILVPSVVADLAQNPEELAFCAKHLSLILYIGGDLPQAIGDVVARQIPLRCWWGASEVGIPHQLIPQSPGFGPGDWRYIRFHPSVGATFDPISDNTYELVIRQDKALSRTQSTFAIKGQEDLKEYRTKDLFQPHPTVPDAWCWRSRSDDIIVFLNGEKTNPVAMEQHVVASHSELGGALVVGAQRFQAALLVEPAGLHGPLTTAEQAALIERIWPTVQEANALVPAHAKIEKSLVLVVDRPLIRAGKGTIQRAASVQQYHEQIETLYMHADVIADAADEEENSPAEDSLRFPDPASVARFVRQSVCDVVGQPVPDQASFFDHGMDSLMALQILRLLRRGLYRSDLGLSTLYSNPTISQLSAAILSVQDDDPGSDGDALLLEPMLKTYSALIEQIPKPAAVGNGRKDEPITAILTGSTGTVGTFLLRALLDRPGIGHVFCLNRSDDGGRGVQKLRMAERGLASGDLDGKVTFLHADFRQPHLGLDDKAYKALCASAGLIIHNAWPVNFNWRLAAFRPQLAGLVHLLRLSAEAAAASLGHPASFVFISSVSAVGTGGPEVGSHAAAPERVLLDLRDAPRTNGYARSKFLSELLCEKAARQLGIPVTVARVGQVAGAVRRQGGGGGGGGEWNRREWLPSLVTGSLAMGCIPDGLGPQFSEIDWVPVDLLADVLVELIHQSSGQPSAGLGDSAQTVRVYNLRNPRTTTWSLLLPSVLDAAKKKALAGPDGVLPEVVPPATWLKRLEDVAAQESGDGMLTNPAVKLLEFYRDALWGGQTTTTTTPPPMSIEQASAHSTALRNMPAISPQWMQKWVGEWIRYM